MFQLVFVNLKYKIITMKYILILVVIFLMFSGCKKDKYTTAPQITFKSLKPNQLFSNISFDKQEIPILTLQITDAEGDLGFKAGADTSKIFIKNLLTNRQDSMFLPVLTNATTKNFQADIKINVLSVIEGSNRPRPKTDTIFFEVYVKDFAKNKSNVVKTTEAVFFITP